MLRMGGGSRKINCDFCGVAYPANAEARRTHNRGSRHRSLRSQFYDGATRTGPRGVSQASRKETTLSVNPLATAYWITENVKLPVGVRMLLRPQMSLRQPSIVTTTMFVPSPYRQPDPIGSSGIKKPAGATIHREGSQAQKHQRNASKLGFFWNSAGVVSRPKTTSCAVKPPVFSAQPPSLTLDGSPTNIRIRWLD